MEELKIFGVCILLIALFQVPAIGFLVLICVIIFIIFAIYQAVTNPSIGGGGSGGSYSSSSTSERFIPSMCSNKLYDKSGEHLLSAYTGYDDNSVVAYFGNGEVYANLTAGKGILVGLYKDNKIYSKHGAGFFDGTYKNDCVVAIFNPSTGKIYKGSGGFFDGTYNESDLIGYCQDGKIYDKSGEAFFGGSFKRDSIVAYYNKDKAQPIEAVAAAVSNKLI